MLRLALHGGLMSGKSTLARRLVNDHGFHYVNYTDMIKEFAVAALASIGFETTVAEIHADKPRFRQFLIELATLLDFDHGYGVPEIAEAITERRYERVVFDNVRFPAQFAKLREVGFRLVRIDTPLHVRLARAADAGISHAAYLARLEDKTERPLPHYPGEISLSVAGDMEQVIAELTVKLLEAETAEREGRAAALAEETVGRSA